METLEADNTSSPEILSRSWGDRFKKTAFDKGVYVGLNYFINAMGSAALAYYFKVRHELKFSAWSESAGRKLGALTGLSAKRMNDGVTWVIQATLLTLVGTGIAPFIKLLEDSRRRIQFGLGHRLDRLQQRLGNANAATEQNISDYEKVQQAVANPGSVTFTEVEKERLRIKHRLEINGDSSIPLFKEHRLSWKSVFTARIAGWAVADGVNFLFGFADKNANPKLRYTHYEDKLSGPMDRFFKRIPGYTRLFPDKKVGDREIKYSKLLANDTVLTVISSITHKLVQNTLHRDDEEEVHSHSAPLQSTWEHRKKPVAQQPAEFRTREETRAETPTLAVQ